MYSENVTVGNIFDKYANPIAEVVSKACSHEADVYASLDNKRVNLKSIMGIMAFQWDEGLVVKVEGTGEDAEEAVKEICSFLSCQ